MAMLRPASEMKDSGIEWVGQIPYNWYAKKARWLFAERNSKGNPVSVQLLTPSQKYGVLPQSLYQEVSGTKPVQVGEDKDLSEFKTVRRGDFCISLSAYMGGFEYSDYEGVISPAYHSFYKISDEINNAYYRYLFKSSSFIDVVNLITPQSVRVGRNTSFESFKEVVLPIPPLTEQQAIADYLDKRCSKIDEIIADAAASIDEYKKLKQALITEAVTHGIQFSTKKYSGFSWIGDIPIHWRTAQLKRFASIQSGITLGKKYNNPRELIEVPYLRVANVQSEYTDLSDVSLIKVLPSELEKYRLHSGELLMTEGGDRDKLGRGCIWNGEIDPCIHQNHVFALSINNPDLFVKYLDFVTTSDVGRYYFDLTAKKTTNLACTNSTTIMSCYIPVPALNEQKEIVEYLNTRVANINALIIEKQSLIEDLKAYKKSLIYEVVTGKRRVV